LNLAREEALNRREYHVGAEFLLLGIIRQSQVQPSPVSLMLRDKHESILHQLEEDLGVGVNEVTHRAVLAPRAIHILRQALSEAEQLGQIRVGPEHVLLGILRDGNSYAAKLLQISHVTLEEARAQLTSARQSH
jgi:ATP-dependent Clp protease ATP-binding subunit ClpC